VDGTGKPWSWQGAEVYRIIEGFIDQAGTWTDSVYGGFFVDDPAGKQLSHNRTVRTAADGA